MFYILVSHICAQTRLYL